MQKNNKIEQGTAEWHHLRKGKVTGTVLKSIMGTAKAKEDAFYKLLGERLKDGIGLEYSNAMERGNALEPDAVAAFELETGLQVERTGFAQDDDNPMIANSPDGLIGETEAIEIKCPEEKNHVKYWLENKLPDEYKWQVVQYFIVNEKLQKLYFVSYNPEIWIQQLVIIEVTREELTEDIEKARVAQEEIIKAVNEKLKELIEF